MCKLKDVGDSSKDVTPLIRRQSYTTSEENGSFDYYSYQ
jgi:hypothetical protein